MKGRVRRLLLLVGAVVFVDTMFFAALTPLLPEFAERLDLSKGEAGELVPARAVAAPAGGPRGGAAQPARGADRRSDGFCDLRRPLRPRARGSRVRDLDRAGLLERRRPGGSARGLGLAHAVVHAWRAAAAAAC